MTREEILNKWAEFTEYDSNQKQFNLLSQNYDYHKAGKNIENLLASGYDPDGTLAILYAKRSFENIMRKSRVIVYDLLSMPDALKDVYEMWNIFHSQEVIDIQENFMSSIAQLTQLLISNSLLPAPDKKTPGEDINILMESVVAVVEELTRCRLDVYQKGGLLQKETHFNRHIQVFNTMADCLIALQTASDGLYLCFINCNGTADGYFAFVMKNNGNIFAVHERIDEEFIGQHASGRNNRWTEGKLTNLFPYSIISGYDFDYKGYVKQQMIDEEKLDFSKQELKDYLPVVLGLYLISVRFQNDVLKDNELVYMDTLLPVNLEAGQKDALMLQANTLMTSHQNLSLNFPLEDVLSGIAGDQFDFEKNRGTETREHHLGGFSNRNQIMVDLWSEGFEYHPEEIFCRDVKLLPSKNNKNAPIEFVGDEFRMQMEAYRQIRIHLAEYIRAQIFEEYVRFGGIKGIRNWFKSTIRDNIKRFIQIAACATLDEGEDNKFDEVLTGCKIRQMEEKRLPIEMRDSFNITDLMSEDSFDSHSHICPITGTKASIYVLITPKNWKALELLLDKELPKILKGWKESHDCSTNYLLNAADAVETVGTPIEYRERLYNASNYYGRDGLATKRLNAYVETNTSDLKPRISVGFSKRGLAKVLKEIKDE